MKSIFLSDGLPSLFSVTVATLVIVAPSTSALCVQGEDDIETLDCLLKDYDVLERPQKLTVVNLSILSNNVYSPDETSLDYQFNMRLTHLYTDPRLRFQPKAAGDEKGINAWYHMTRIWRPFVSIVENQSPAGFASETETMTVYPSGTVEFVREINVELFCRTVLERFPFDNPVCFLTTLISGYTRQEVQLNWQNSTLNVTNPSTVFFNSYLERSTLASCSDEESDTYNAACLKGLLLFSRERSVYWVTVFIPGFVYVTSSFMSFWLSVRAAPPRAMIGTTTRLNFLSSANSFRNKLPSVSNLVAINVWDSVSIIFIYISLLEFIFVDYLDRHPRTGEEADIQYLERALRRPGISAWERFCFYFRKPNKEISSDIDVMSRTIFPILYFGFIIGYFIAYQGHFSVDIDYSRNVYKHLIT